MCAGGDGAHSRDQVRHRCGGVLIASVASSYTYARMASARVTVDRASRSLHRNDVCDLGVRGGAAAVSAGVLAAGVVRVVRVAAGATWSRP